MRTPLFAIALLAASGASPQPLAEPINRLQIFNDCRPLRLLVEDLPADAAIIGLTKEALQDAAESHLRAARLHTDDIVKAGSTFLYVDVDVVGQGFSTNVRYFKKVTDVFGASGHATTWSTRTTGIHGRNAGFIVSSLSRHLDRFLASYLRVNEKACGGLEPRP